MAHTEYRRLPDAELEVMQALWACEGPASRAEIQNKLAPGRSMAPTTLLTLLARLGEKGFVQAEKEGRATRYTPLVNRQDYLAQQGSRFFHQVCGGSLPAFASALCGSGLSREELEELSRLLERGQL